MGGIEKTKERKTTAKQKCRFCNQEKHLIEAHIVPKWAYKLSGRDKQNRHVLHNASKPYPIKSPIGVYDKNILCGECDRQIGEYDEYGKDILTKTIPNHKREGFFEITDADYDYPRLKKFFISILWRASISSQEAYNKVQLGPYEETAKEIIQGSKIGNNIFEIMLCKYTHTHNYRHIDTKIHVSHLAPIKIKHNGINHYDMDFAGYKLLIKVDKQKGLYPLNEFYLTQNKMKILEINWDEHSGQQLELIIKNHHARRI